MSQASSKRAVGEYHNRDYFAQGIRNQMHAASEFTDHREFEEKVAGPWRQRIPHYSQFKGIYDPAEIEVDKNYTEEILQRIIEKAARENNFGKMDESKMCEPVMMEGIERHEWLGSNTFVTPTMKYDDLKGTDLVVSFDLTDHTNPNAKEEIVHLAIDTTSSQDRLFIDGKLEKTIQLLSKGECAMVKYFANDDIDSIKGTISAPRVVVGLEPEHFRELQDSMSRRDKTLEDHEVKKQLLQEVKEQLTFALHYLLYQLNLPKFPWNDIDTQPETDELLRYAQEHEDDIHAKNTKYALTIAQHAKVLEQILTEYKKSSISKRSFMGDYLAGTLLTAKEMVKVYWQSR